MGSRCLHADAQSYCRAHLPSILDSAEPSKYTGDFSYFPVAEPHKYWQLDLASLNIGPGASPVAGDGSGRDISKSAVIDSGTTLIAAMKNDVAAFWAG